MLREGDEVLLDSPGGGGWGDARERAPERVLEDVLDGKVSVEAAFERYGVRVEGGRAWRP